MGDPRNQTMSLRAHVVVTAASGANAVPANSATARTIKDLIEANMPATMHAHDLGRIVAIEVEATGAAVQFGKDAGHMGASPTHVKKLAAGETRLFRSCDALDWLIQAQAGAATGVTIEVFTDYLR